MPRDDHKVETGTLWAPAVDLALRAVSTFAWRGQERFVPARDVWSIATGTGGARLLRGTVLRLEDVLPDFTWEGMGANAWSVDPAGLGVAFLRTALEGRWGGAAVLADRLIVPLDHPIVGHDDAPTASCVTYRTSPARSVRITASSRTDLPAVLDAHGRGWGFSNHGVG